MRITKFNRIRGALLSCVAGFLAGIAATLFLVLLDIATQARDSYPRLIGWLPVAGFFIGYVYYIFGKDVAGGNNLILEEIHNPKKTIPFRMAPFILLGTVVTHLFGGSAGREGTAVQMGASLADQVAKFFKVGADERKVLLVAGTGAGFGAAIGAPWAGVVFGMEVIQIGRLRLFAWLECFIASFTAYYTTHFLNAPHTLYPPIGSVVFSPKNLVVAAISGIIFGLTARLFSLLTHRIEKIERRFISYPPLKPLVGGLLLVFFFYLEGSYRYVGLGISSIQSSLIHISSLKDPIFKLLFTALTVGSGFKGGEFIPLVFIGSTLGSAMSDFFSVPVEILAAVGFAAVFAAASNTPFACVVMASEIFGFSILPYAILACFIAYYVSGHQGIYSSQLVKEKKTERFRGLLGELPKRFLSRLPKE